MTIKRMDHVSVVVDDLPAAIAFFTTLGMAVEGEMPVEIIVALSEELLHVGTK
jgi:catechol 2,3-dioxygenase-like lactoylglutathione lyase family enzyme